MTGLITEGEPEAPLYDLKLFVHAYLEGEQITSPVSEESLLIRDVSLSKKVGSWIAKYAVPSSNSKLKFPSGAGWFSETPPLDPAKGEQGALSQKAIILSEIKDERENKNEDIHKILDIVTKRSPFTSED